jgi:hypothetical protein
MDADPNTIALSLISHTNAGKTTLARTLLARDVGEVRDAPHVTTEATAYPLLEAPGGERLVLWDTPGFGDSVRLARRLQQQENPILWFLTQVWDRFRDRPFWLTQLAVRNVRDHADVVLYLVNASEQPVDAGYLASEFAVLAWMGKPVIVLLNQTGPPRAQSVEAAEASRWREALQRYPEVRAVLMLDAFARCWVQELVLFDTIGEVLPPPRRAVFSNLATAWQARRWSQFDEAMAALAVPIAQAACARVLLARAPLADRLGKALGLTRDDAESDQARALQSLARQLDESLRAAMERLIAIHGLDGRAADEVNARLATDVITDAPIDEGKAAAVGGILSGAMTGLAADLATGGLTFGAGMLAGALMGALGGAGVARGMNVVRRKTDAAVTWDSAFLDGLVVSALLRYLAVAHYGRGRGEWKASEYPLFWRELVTAVVAARQQAFTELWSSRRVDCDAVEFESRLKALLAGAARAALAELYPGALASAGPRDVP